LGEGKRYRKVTKKLPNVSEILEWFTRVERIVWWGLGAYRELKGSYRRGGALKGGSHKPGREGEVWSRNRGLGKGRKAS